MRVNICNLLTTIKFLVGIVIGVIGIWTQNWIGLIAIWPIYEGIVAWRNRNVCLIPVKVKTEHKRHVIR